MSMEKKELSPVVCIVGPTASGKTEASIRVAERFNCEIVSADSMQLYRGLEIGVAKPTVEEQKMVRHHLLDIMDITEKSDIFRFCADAENAQRQTCRNRRSARFSAGYAPYQRRGQISA